MPVFAISIMAILSLVGATLALGMDSRSGHQVQQAADAAALGDVGNRIEVMKFDNLLVQFAAEQRASVVIRGLRAVSDFDYEFQMASMNAKLAPEIDTVCLMASDSHQFIASSLIKEIAKLGGDVSQFVSPRVAKLLTAKVSAL